MVHSLALSGLYAEHHRENGSRMRCSASEKCSCQSSARGLNSGVNSSVTGSIDARYRSLEPIAVAAREAEIVQLVGALMLSRANVLDVKPCPRLGGLNESAILADVACSRADLIAYGLIHRHEPLRWSTWRALNCMMLMKSIAWM